MVNSNVIYSFQDFLLSKLLSEAAPLGPPGAPPSAPAGGLGTPGALPGGGGPPPMPPLGGLGPPPGMPPGMGGPPAGGGNTPPEKLKAYNVWDVLERVLGNQGPNGNQG